MNPFAIYCLIVGVLNLGVFAAGFGALHVLLAIGCVAMALMLSQD